jgi:hypothetical protein
MLWTESSWAGSLSRCPLSRIQQAALASSIVTAPAPGTLAKTGHSLPFGESAGVPGKTLDNEARAREKRVIHDYRRLRCH